ncbi:hypothetical protein V866_007943 [Kwoniella sp. B9012]
MSDTLSQPTNQAGLGAGALETLPYGDNKAAGWELSHLETTATKLEATNDNDLVAGGHSELVSSWEDIPYRTTLKIFWRGVLVCFLAAFSSFTDGYQIAIIGNIIGNQGFINTMSTAVSPITGAKVLAPNILSAWTAVGSVSQWLGMNIFPFVADRFGRKICMIGYWVIITIGVACETASKDYKLWTASKVFSGLGVGAMQFSLQMYITELSPTSKIRGSMLSCFNFWWTIGLFVGTVAITIEHNRDPLNWKTIILTQWSQVGIMGIIYVFLLPESPWWYAKKGMHEKGKKVLQRLYGKVTGYDAEVEYGIIRRTVEAEEEFAATIKEIPWRAIFTGVNGWRTLVSSYELTAGTFIGQTFLSTYTIYFFEIAGSTNGFSNTCITSGLGIVSCVVLVLGLDSIGRRRIVCYCFSTQWICLFLIGCIGLVKNRSSGLNKFLIFLACLWSFCFYMAGGAGWSLVGEVSTARLRARTAGFAAGFAVLIGIPLGYGTPYMISETSLNWGLKTCFFYAGLAFLPVVGAWFVIPETAHRSAAELDEMFEGKVKPWRFRKYETEVQKAKAPSGDAATVFPVQVA